MNVSKSCNPYNVIMYLFILVVVNGYDIMPYLRSDRERQYFSVFVLLLGVNSWVTSKTPERAIADSIPEQRLFRL